MTSVAKHARSVHILRTRGELGRTRSFRYDAPVPPPGGGFGDRLNEALRQRGVRKLYPLALEIGVDESALSRWRKGGAISLDSAIRLADRLDVSLDWLLIGRGGIDGHKAHPQVAGEDERLLHLMQSMRDRLPPHSFALFVNFLESIQS